MADEILQRVRETADKRLLFLPHTIRQMSHPDRMISTTEVEAVVKTDEVIEDYPEDVRGHSCLMLGFGRDDRAVHVVCAPKDEYLAIITAYLPNPDQWTSDFRERL
ncbi:MAG: DUF4258 domain-containing protein [Acaryochloris sp. RU_4_1]|nr:DUF4258 domain-containing protein [Acaryochloris sp. RU_4_1]NJN38339.1 DUF4258 domain-containing protein [Acaryochloridaceae cyanobacterium CSU_3_4]NJR53584.1 DUF4258 domain-containing protein [Acaryochloris sp. CRU_2_0]